MGFYNKDNNRSNRGERSHNSSSRGYDRPEMFKAVCTKCNRDCEVPFRPSGDKPVYCSNCFEKNGGNDRGNDQRRNSDSRRSGNDNFRRSNFEDRQMYTAVCAKCGKNCELPFRPTSGRPVFCSDCFEKNSAEGRPEKTVSEPSQNYQKQFDDLNSKLDKILSLLTPSTLVDDVVEQVVIQDISELPVETPKKRVRKTATK